jgi:hypothetical protein
MAATAGLRATRLAFSQQRLFLGAEAIRAGLAEVGCGFLPFVFGIEEAADRREQMQTALQRYTAAIARHHRQDEVISVSEGGQ